MEQQNFQDVESLPSEKLLKLAEENLVKVNYADAEYFYTVCLKKSPDNEEASSQYAECLKTQGKFEEAIVVLTNAINVAAASKDKLSDYKKFLQLAELKQGEESLKLYEQAIEHIRLGVASGVLSEANADVRRDLSEAYAGLAEIYQTDFLHLAESEPKVIECIEKAMQADPTALEAHLQQANYFLNKENEDAAKAAVKRVIDGLVSPINEDDHYDDSFKVNAAKICVEVSEFVWPVAILEQVVLSNDSNLEAHYLLAFCEYKSGHFYSALEYTQSLLANPDLEADEEIFTATQELKDAIDAADFTQAKDGEGYENAQKVEGAEEEEDDEEWMDIE